MEITYSGSNITVKDGIVCIRGRFAGEDSSTTIDAGKENSYCKLVLEVNLDKTNTEDNLQQLSYKIVRSSSSYPSLTQTDIVANNSGIYQFELASFRTTSSGITDFKQTKKFIDYDSIFKEIEEKINNIENGSIYALKENISAMTATFNNAKLIAVDTISKFNLEKSVLIGDKFTLENGGIRINKGVSKILISAQATLSYATKETVHLAIYRQNEEVARVVSQDNNAIQSSLNISNKLIDVKENDYIYLYLKGKDVQFSGTDSLTYLTVQAVE